MDDSPLRRLAASLLRQPADQEDALQETWLAALSGQAVIREEAAWRRGVLRNKALRVHRNRTRENDLGSSPETTYESAAPTPPELADRALVRELLRATLAELPDAHAQVLQLRYFEDLSPAEIAKRLQRPASTVKTQLSRGLAEMRERLDRRTGSKRGTVLALAGAFDFNAEVALRGAGVASATGASGGLPALLAAVLLLVAAAVGGLLWIASPNADADPKVDLADLDPQESASALGAVDANAREGRRAIEPAPAGTTAASNTTPLEATAPEAPAAAAATMELTFVGITQTGVNAVGFRVEAWDADGPSRAVSAPSKADGRVTVEVRAQEVHPFHRSTGMMIDGLESARGARFSIHGEAMAAMPDVGVPFVGGSQREVELRFHDDPAKLNLTVVDDAGAPLEGATLIQQHQPVRTEGDVLYLAEDRTAQSGADGLVVLEGLLPGQGDMRLRCPGYAPFTFVFSIQPGQHLEGSLPLKAAVRLTGIVRSAQGDPIEGAYVLTNEWFHDPATWAVTDADGAYEFWHMPAGRHEFWAYPPGDANELATAVIDLAGDTVVWNPTLAPSKRLRARLSDETGAPVANAFLLAFDGDEWSQTAWYREAATDEEGLVTIDRCPDRPLTLGLMGGDAVRGFQLSGSQRYRGLVPGEEIHLLQVNSSSRKLGVVRGLVVDAEGSPAARAVAWLRSPDDSMYQFLRTEKGAFESAPVPPGSYLVAYGNKGVGFREIEAELEESADLDLGELRLPPTASLRIIDRWGLEATPNRRMSAVLSPFGRTEFLETRYRNKPLNETFEATPGLHLIEVLGPGDKVIQRRFVEVRLGEVNSVTLDPKDDAPAIEPLPE